MSNLKTYQNKKTVTYYCKSEGLQLPETEILKSIGGKLNNANVLDIGVGGGRTTPYFAKNTKYYLGIDFSEEFITACKNKYKNTFPLAEFKTVDARALEGFDEQSFDIILFSFNGIDNVSFEERNKVITAIQKLLTPNGYFIFSSHNTNYLPILSKYKWYRNPFATIKTAYKHYQFLKMNSVALKNNATYTFIYDDTYDFGLTTCYINAQYQKVQLEKNGFFNVDIYSLNTGKKLLEQELLKDESAWLYYVCQKKSI